MGWLASLFSSTGYIDLTIEKTFGPAAKKLIVSSVTLPAYRFVDLYGAVSAHFDGKPRVKRIETRQQEGLNDLIHADRNSWADRAIHPAPRTAWPIGPSDETYLPVDCFWLCPSRQIEACFIARLSLDHHGHEAKLEIASGDADEAKAMLDRILEHSRQHSIYRDHILHMAHEAAKRDEYGDIEKAERLQVIFSSIEPVSDEDIVLAEDHLAVLTRNVIDLHARRDILDANAVPARRGVLLHGPPGTGKTFACRYLCHRLKSVTRIFVSGSSLLNVSAIFSFARLMQPAVVFLEDVDLIFASREINLYSTALGDLLDQMDGLRAHENISVVLTTNAIDRLEAAIKDRPGRISQCVYMGAPAARQRKLFIKHQLAQHNAKGVDLDLLVAESDGATQAFLKEWVRRAVQIACERLDSPKQKAKLRDADFTEALTEMRSFLEGSDGHIIGFRPR